MKIFHCIGIAAFVYFYLLAPDNLSGADKEEKWPNGKTKKVYSLDAENKKNGAYQEFYEDGQIRIKSFYQNNLLEGNCLEYLADGKIKQETNYKKGLKNGFIKIYDKGLLNKTSIYQDNELIFTYPKSPAEIAQGLEAIPKLKTEFVGEWPKDFQIEQFTKEVENDNISGLGKLREYRFLCGLPYEDLQISKEYIGHNLNGLIILKKLKAVNHFPENPGLPENIYKSGYLGTSNSNLAHVGFMEVTSSQSISMYMNDSDAMNIMKLGHRRWCLSPNMKKTGFAAESGFEIMWAADMGKKNNPPNYDVICYPARGYMPISHFQNSSAWSASLNPKIYTTKSTNTIKIKVFSFKDSIDQELKLSFEKISSEYIGTTNCLIFKPENISVTPQSCYHVLITGVNDKYGKETKVEYFVEFY